MPFGDTNTIPIPAPRKLDTPCTPSIVWANSATKFSSIYPLMAFLCLYQMSKDPSLVPYLTILLVKSDLLNKAYRGCLVKTYTV